MSVLISITKAPPVEAKHGISLGRVFPVLRRAGSDYVVRGDAGEDVRVHRRECIEVTDLRGGGEAFTGLDIDDDGLDGGGEPLADEE